MYTRTQLGPVVSYQWQLGLSSNAMSAYRPICDRTFALQG